MVDAYESKDGNDGKTGLKEGGGGVNFEDLFLFALFFLCNESVNRCN